MVDFPKHVSKTLEMPESDLIRMKKFWDWSCWHTNYHEIIWWLEGKSTMTGNELEQNRGSCTHLKTWKLWNCVVNTYKLQELCASEWFKSQEEIHMNELVCLNPAHIFVLGDLVVSTILELPFRMAESSCVTLKPESPESPTDDSCKDTSNKDCLKDSHPCVVFAWLIYRCWRDRRRQCRIL